MGEEGVSTVDTRSLQWQGKLRERSWEKEASREPMTVWRVLINVAAGSLGEEGVGPATTRSRQCVRSRKVRGSRGIFAST